MKNRIIGEEIEWTGGYLSEAGTWSPVGDKIDLITREIVLNYKHCADNGVFLPNGARVYRESTGQHLETASPECSSARELLIFDKWSELFVQWVAGELKKKYGVKTMFYKKNADSGLGGSISHINTRGCHENYLSDKKFDTLIRFSETNLRNAMLTRIPVSIDAEINYFILFLITRQIFTGAGGVMIYSSIGGEDIYEISPRTNFLDAIISSSTTSGGSSGRSIINLRPEPLACGDEFFRNHLILGDANMADLSIFLKFGTTSAIIEMLEESFWDKELCLGDVSEAPKLLKAISKDLTLSSVPIKLKNGKSYTAIQIQKKYCRNWHRYLKRTCQSGEKAEIAERWREILGRLEIDDEKLYSQLDWKIKMRLIRDFMDKKGLSLNNVKVVNLDKVYHSPDPEISFYYKLKNRPGAQFESLVSRSEILEADKTPPENRAKLRAYLKKLFDELDLESCVNWDWVTFKATDSFTEYKIHMADPRLSSLSSLNREINNSSIASLNNLRPGAIVI